MGRCLAGPLAGPRRKREAAAGPGATVLAPTGGAWGRVVGPDIILIADPSAAKDGGVGGPYQRLGRPGGPTAPAARRSDSIDAPSGGGLNSS